MKTAIAAMVAAIILTPTPAHAGSWPTYYGGQTGEVILCKGNHFGISVNRSGGVWRELAHCDSQVWGQRPNGTWAQFNGAQTGELVFCRGHIKISRYTSYPRWWTAHCVGKTLKGW